MEPNRTPQHKNNDPQNRQDNPNHSSRDLTQSEERFQRGTDIDPFAVNEEKHFSDAKHEGNDVANNDGSVLETLDTAFHDKPGYAEGESISGSNKAEYYEERSYGQSDDEEELDAGKETNPGDESNK